VSRSDRIEAPSMISARGALVMPSSWARWNFPLSRLQQRPREPAGDSSVRRARLRNERFALKAAPAGLALSRMLYIRHARNAGAVGVWRKMEKSCTFFALFWMSP
jgi:hypothetical protein